MRIEKTFTNNIWNSLLTVLLVAAFMTFAYGKSLASDDAGVRKQLLITEQRVNNVASQNGQKDEAVGENYSEVLDAADNTDAVKSEKRQPGEVSFELGTGTLTRFSVSSKGLDSTGNKSVTGIKLMLRESSLEVNTGSSGGSVSNAFPATGRQSLYGTENFADMRDMFEEEDKARDYMITGVWTGLDAGRVSVSALNFLRLPDRKKYVFFGNGAAGPYRVQDSGIVPDSERVWIEGEKISRGSEYTVNYTTGDVTFSRQLMMSERVVIEYEATGSAGAKAGRFTGFSIKQKNGSIQKSKSGGMTLSDFGATWLSDETFNNEIFRSRIVTTKSQQRVVGTNAVVTIGSDTKIGMEVASSSGARTSDEGNFASAKFTISDSTASDKNPLGPYLLDTNFLPIVEGSEEVAINGVLLVYGRDYYLDRTYGWLRLMGTFTTLSPLDVITVTYRYKPESGLFAAGDGVDGTAAIMSLETKSSGFTLSSKADVRDANFMLIGSDRGNNLRNLSNSISWKSGRKLAASFSSTDDKSVISRASGVNKRVKQTRVQTDYSTGSLKTTLSISTGSTKDNLSLCMYCVDTDSYQLAAEFAKPKAKNRYSLKAGNDKSSDLRNGADARTTTRAAELKAAGMPVKGMRYDATYSSGNSKTCSTAGDRDTDKSGLSLSVNYAVSRRLTMSATHAKTDQSSFETATSTAVTFKNTGSVEDQMHIQYQPDSKTIFSATTGRYVDRPYDGALYRTTRSFDMRRTIGKSIYVQAQRYLLDSQRTAQTQRTANDTYSLNGTKRIGGKNTTFFIRQMNGKTVMRLVSNDVHTNSVSSNTNSTVSASLPPFWEDRQFTFEISRRKNRQLTDGQSNITNGERRVKTIFEIPFIGTSYWRLSHEKTRQTGGYASRTTVSTADLNEDIFDKTTFRLGYRSERHTDSLAHAADRTDTSFEIIVERKGTW